MFGTALRLRRLGNPAPPNLATALEVELKRIKPYALLWNFLAETVAAS